MHLVSCGDDIRYPMHFSQRHPGSTVADGTENLAPLLVKVPHSHHSHHAPPIPLRKGGGTTALGGDEAAESILVCGVHESFCQTSAFESTSMTNDQDSVSVGRAQPHG